MSPFVFQNPLLLLPLLAVPPLAGVLVHARKRRAAVMKEMGAGEPPPFAPWRDGLRLAAIVLLVLALARPGFDPRRQSLSRSGRDVVFVLDVSRSMLAEDAAPNRLDAARNGIRDALESFRHERVGLVIYAGSASILCPLTFDYGFVRYMLDQAAPRAVDFGGTVLLSAVEKCVGSVFIAGREGLQDLVVLTDGEEHGPQNQRIAELLEKQGADMLLVGIGDPSAGSRIPVVDEEGKRSWVKYQDQYVTTRLHDEELRGLARQTNRVDYRAAGASGFDLARIYSEYVAGKPVSGSGGADSFVTYREAGFALIALALLLLAAAEGWIAPRGKVAARVVLLAMIVTPLLSTAEDLARELFDEAVVHQEAGRHSEAFEAFTLVEEEFGGGELPIDQVAVLRFNQGLSLFAQSEAQASQDPRQALSLALEARDRFLAARRMRPDFDRAGQRLDPLAGFIRDCQERIAEQEKTQQTLREQVRRLVEMLKSLHQSQSGLRDRVPVRSARAQAKNLPETVPDRAESDSGRFHHEQRRLNEEGREIADFMAKLDRQLTPDAVDPDSLPVGLLQEPLLLQGEAIEAGDLAAGLLGQWATWPEARVQQQVVLDRIQAILDRLAGDPSAEEGDGEPSDEESPEMENTDSADSMNASREGQGDFAAAAEMQALPVPNYSVEDILREEKGNVQFRQQLRAARNQGKVEKDW